MSLFYFNRLKVNIVFCILLLHPICANSESVQGKYNVIISTPIAAGAKLDLLDLLSTEQILKYLAKRTGYLYYPMAPADFRNVNNPKFKPLDSKLAPPTITESRIQVKLSREVEIDYMKFLEFKNRWAKKDFKKAKSMLEFLDRVDRIENYKFVEGSL